MKHERKRPPSYSDSYYILNGDPLLPLVSVTSYTPLETTETTETTEITLEPQYYTIIRFTLKGGLHLLFISTFETVFYFLYISVSEDQGILNTINTYYMPFVQGCNTWSNLTRGLILDIFKYEMNKSQIDSDGISAFNTRNAFNRTLQHASIIYSIVFLSIVLAMVGLILYIRIPIQWKRLFTEHLAFVTLLALYEYFFYKTIIYNYTTISTSELNRYIVDGLYQCASK